jgi:hypothetical protein
MDAACPLSAHIRKVNPREGLRDTDAVPRILRRGAPFGPPYAEGETPPPAGRGLALISYQTRIIEQFGTLTSHWMNDPLLPPGEGGHDLLVGQVPAGQQRSLELAGHNDGVCTVHAGTRSWVNVTGGAFLFAPSLGVLRSLADGPVGRG